MSRFDYVCLMFWVAMTAAMVGGMTLAILIEQPWRDINVIREILEATPTPTP